MRGLLGIGTGAEWPSGAALAMESWPERTRGLFWIGILPALIIVCIRFFVEEPAVWVENRRRQREMGREVRVPLVRIFRRPLLGNTFSACWWMISGFVVYYSINALFATHLQKDLHFTPAQVAFPVAMASVVGLIASGVWGLVSDRVGRQWSAIIPGLLTIPVAAAYLLARHLQVVVWGFIVQGAFGQAIYWLNPVYLAERFPTEVRAAASAFC